MPEQKSRGVTLRSGFIALFPTLEPDGEIHILGTRYNPLDLYEDLIKSKDYVVNTQRAIRVVNGKSISLGGKV